MHNQNVLTLLQELIQQATPLLPEQVGSGQAAISTNHTQVGDTALHEVVCSFQASLVGTKLFTSCTANDCTTLKQKEMNRSNQIFLCL